MPNNRKYILWFIFGILLVFYGGDWLVNTVVRAPMESAQAQNKKLREQIRRKESDLKTIRREKKQLKVWEKQSLPADPRMARSLYQAWLVRLVEHVGLKKPNVDSGDPVNRKNMYDAFSFTVRGQGSLEQLTRLLYEFYQAGHLHQIRSLELTPMEQGRQFGIALAIEALALPQIERKDALGTSDVKQLACDKLADYDVIARRNVFRSGGDPNVLTYTRLTAVTRAQGADQAWFSADLQGKTFQKAAGEVLEIGPFRGKVLEIDGDDVVMEIDGQRRLLTIGETLSQAAALPPGL